MATARYRDRHAVTRKKSDPGDALVLANILRTDMHAHRPLPQDGDLARAIAVLARPAGRRLEPAATRQPAPLAPARVLPAALDAYLHWQNGLCRPETRVLLELTPTPSLAARLSLAQLPSALKRAGRQRRIDAAAERIREVLRAEYAHQPPLAEDAQVWMQLD